MWYVHLSPILCRHGKSYSLVDLVDSEIRSGRDNYRDFKELIPRAGRYLLSPVTSAAPLCFEVMDFLREQQPGATILVGGPHATHADQELLQRGADVVVRGEGEAAFEQLVLGEDLDKIPGISFLHQGSLCRIGQPRIVGELDTLPLFDWNILPANYNPSFYGRLFMQRGCPMRCSFCADVLWSGRQVRKKSMARITREIEDICEKLDFVELHFADNCFSLDLGLTSGVSRVLADQGVCWSVETRVDLVESRVLSSWSRSGCVEVEYGCESASDSVLKASAKQITVDEMRAAFRMTKDAGISVHTNWMIGLPGDTEDDARKTIDFVCEAIQSDLIDTLDYYIMVPYPGTPVACDPARFGMTVKQDDWSAYVEDEPPVAYSQDFRPTQVYETYLEGIRRFGEALG